MPLCGLEWRASIAVREQRSRMSESISLHVEDWKIAYIYYRSLLKYLQHLLCLVKLEVGGCAYSITVDEEWRIYKKTLRNSTVMNFAHFCKICFRSVSAMEL